LGIRTLSELIEYAKKNPDKLSYASAGNGSLPHMMMELLRAQTNIAMVHIPYRGSGPALTDLIGGQVDLAFDTVSQTEKYVKSGRLIALAVATQQRSPYLPSVPTMREAGLPNYTVTV